MSHLDSQGNAVMVDIGGKPSTQRRACAAGRIRMSAACYALLREGGVPKGDVLAVARVAGMMAAKKTSGLIPLCHPLMLTKLTVDFLWHDEACAVEVRCAAECAGQTGVEMEALTGASVALLTVYDMCKAVDKAMVISDLRLLEKHGGKSGDFDAEAAHA